MEFPVRKIDISEKSLIEITRFLQETFPTNKKFSLDFIRWQYAKNPLGSMVAFNAYDKDKVISHFAGLPIAMSLFGKAYKGLLCINVSTNENYRGKRLFTILGEKTIQYAKDNDFDFMIAVPNANSTHGFLKYFGFDLIAPLSVKLGTGNNIYTDKKPNCYKLWDEAQWEWRLKNPTNKYLYNRKGIISTPVAYFFKTISQGRVPESLYDATSRSIGFRPFNLYIGLGADTSKGLYLNMPSFIKRPPFNLVFKDLKGGIPKINKEDMFLQLIDLDTI